VALDTAFSPIRQLRQRIQERRFLRLRSVKQLQVELFNAVLVVPHFVIFPKYQIRLK